MDTTKEIHNIETNKKPFKSIIEIILFIIGHVYDNCGIRDKLQFLFQFCSCQKL